MRGRGVCRGARENLRLIRTGQQGAWLSAHPHRTASTHRLGIAAAALLERVRSAAALAASGALVAATTVLSASRSSSSDCTAQNVTLQKVDLSDLGTAFDVSAAANAGSDSAKPLEGTPVKFWAWGSHPGQSSSVGVLLDTATANSSGTVTLHVPPLVRNNEISKLSGLAGLTFAEVSVNIAARTVSGVSYCQGKSSVPVSCSSNGRPSPTVSVRP